jgi:phosphonatase-like hydrolase
MNTELVVFDIAGTTVADEGNVNIFFRTAFADAGINVDKIDVDKVMGYRKVDAVKILLAQYSPDSVDDLELINKIHQDFTHKMIKHYETSQGLTFLPFAEKVFQELQGNNIRVALNTGFSRVITQPILHRLGWDVAPFIDAVICSDEVPEGRPSPDMIRQLVKSLGISHTANVVKVGDTQVDIDEGRNAGCGLVVAVTTGASTAEQLHEYHPDHIIDSLLQLLPLIQ